MATYQSPLMVVVKGAIAGAAGTAAMTAFLDRAPELLGRLGLAAPPQNPPSEPTRASSPTRRVAKRATSIDEGESRLAGGALHWAYGAGWGAYYAVIQSTFRLPSLLHGTWLAGLMTAVAVRVLPQLGLAPAPRGNEQLLTNAAGHAVFGWTTAIVYALLNFGRRG